MPDIALSTQAYDRSVTGGALEILTNMYSEEQPSPTGPITTLISGPGIELFQSGGSGAVQAMLAEDGLFGGDLFIVRGTKFVRVNSGGDESIIGSVSGEGGVTIAASRTEIMVCVAPNLYSYNGTDFELVDMAGQPCSSIAHIGQRFIGTVDGSDRFYWSALLDGRTWDGLNFATAEGRADKIVRGFTTSQYILLFGAKTTEIYALSANPRTESDVVYRVGAGSMPHGLLAPSSVAIESGFAFWLSDKRAVYVASGFRPQKISTPYFHDLIKDINSEDLAQAIGYTYTLNGHTFYVLTVPSHFTLSYDLGSQKWQKRYTLGLKTWRAERGVSAFGLPICAGTQGALYKLNSEVSTDLGDPIIQEWSAPVAVRQPYVMTDLTADLFASAPCNVNMRFTENGGRTWSSFVAARAPSPSFEDTQAMWRGLGTLRAPERIFQFRVSEPARLTVSGARFNDGIN